MRTNQILFTCCIIIIFLPISFVSANKTNILPLPPLEQEPPITQIHYHTDTGIVSLYATDYPIDHCSGIYHIYYILDGETNIYSAPFFIGEGSHTIKYWSEDRAGNVEQPRTASYCYDTTPPNIDIESPTKGVYFLGSKIIKFNRNAICIGGVPIVVNADDGNGTGIKNVYFNILDDSGYDNEAPYEYMFSDVHFGPLTIMVTAEDNKGLISEPVEITVIVYSLGLFKYN